MVWGGVESMPLLVKAELWVEEDPMGSRAEVVAPVEGGCEGECRG